MRETKLKTILGLTVFTIQVLLVLLILFSPFYGVEFADAMGLVTVVAPMLGAYAIAIMKWLVANRHLREDRSKPITRAFAVLSFGVPLVMWGTTTTLFLAYALDAWNISLEQTRFALTGVETIFGVYLSLIIDALYRPNAKNRPIEPSGL